MILNDLLKIRAIIIKEKLLEHRYYGANTLL